MASWLGWKRSLSDEETALLRRRCGSRTSALAVCLATNSAAACKNFAVDTDSCYASVLCKEQAKAFAGCLSAQAPGASNETCKQEVKAMQACLRGCKLPSPKAFS